MKVFAALLASLLLYSGHAHCGDEDSAPAYLIYIDPETKRYTTDDPGVAPAKETVTTAPASDSNRLLLAVLGAAAVLVAVVYRRNRQKSTA